MGNDFSFLCYALNCAMADNKTETKTEYCPRTGLPECKCDNKLASTPMGNALLTDPKCAIKKLFGDHEKYTNWLIISSFGNLSDAGDVVNRLIKNANDIAKFIAPLIDANGNTDKSSIIRQL